MTDKITITKKQFLKWLDVNFTWYIGVKDHAWDELVLESQKKEPIERWIIVSNEGDEPVGYFSKQDAQKTIDNCKLNDTHRIVHLREVEGE